jgi:hypothetical protein
MKTSIKTGLVAIALLIGITANAQDKPVTFGVKAGVNLSNFSGDFDDPSIKVGLHVGVTADFALAPNFYVLSGLEYSMKGAKVENNLKANLSYLNLPVHVGYKLPVADATKIVFHAGPYVGFAVDGSWKSGSFSADIFGDEIKDRGLGMKRFDFGLGFGVGAEFGKINAGVNCDFGLVNIADFGMIDYEGWKLDAKSVSVKNMNVSISLGYKF